MAGKRPDQYQISPREGRTTDYKFNPENKHGQGGDLTEMRAEDKEHLVESKKGGSPAPHRHPAPSKFAREGVKDESTQEDNT